METITANITPFGKTIVDNVLIPILGNDIWLTVIFYFFVVLALAFIITTIVLAKKNNHKKLIIGNKNAQVNLLTKCHDDLKDINKNQLSSLEDAVASNNELTNENRELKKELEELKSKKNKTVSSTQQKANIKMVKDYDKWTVQALMEELKLFNIHLKVGEMKKPELVAKLKDLNK